MIKANYHTHTSFCDGKGSPDEILEEAVKKGFDILGFSSHCAYPFADSWHIAPREFEKYRAAVYQAKENFRGKITVLYGFEADYIHGITKPSIKEDYASLKPDYLIGSVHYVGNEKGIFGIDDKTEAVQEGLQKIFNGDGKKCVQEYFFLQREMLKKGDFTIWGHPDLVRKRNGLLHFFDENEDWYIKELKETAALAKKAGVLAEINTGAIARKAMDSLYPSSAFLSILHEEGIPVIISSDSHSKENLDSEFDRAYREAKKAGYTESAYLDEKAEIRFQKIS